MCSKLICVSNRALCGTNFIRRIRDIIDADIPVILREKDLTEREYYKLLCKIDRGNIISHSFVGAARSFGCSKIHLPLPLLETSDISGFAEAGASTHSVEEAVRARELGASYITAGHVFATDCKKGFAPRGTDLLRDIKNEVDIPVYALGGISPENARKALSAGADGVCVMSGFMKCADLPRYIEEYRRILEKIL